MTDKEKIREFVEEIIKINLERSSIEDYAAVTELRKVLAYIDSISEEPVSKKGAQWQRERMTEKALELVETALKIYAKTHGVQLEDNKKQH